VKQAQELIGGVSHMWFKRRLQDPTFKFPKRHEAGRRRFYWRTDLIVWLQSPHAKEQTRSNFGVVA
jgi:hypothetical protein